MTNPKVYPNVVLSLCQLTDPHQILHIEPMPKWGNKRIYAFQLSDMRENTHHSRREISEEDIRDDPAKVEKAMKEMVADIKYLRMKYYNQK